MIGSKNDIESQAMSNAVPIVLLAGALLSAGFFALVSIRFLMG